MARSSPERDGEQRLRQFVANLGGERGEPELPLNLRQMLTASGVPRRAVLLDQLRTHIELSSDIGAPQFLNRRAAVLRTLHLISYKSNSAPTSFAYRRYCEQTR